MRNEMPIEGNTLWGDVLECVGAIALFALAGLAFWLYLVATPDQCSAECEWQRAEMEAAR